ncbi:hypothetical protein JAAARDRAFT_29087 [Jaapia argillacea MUCL 33604]|uniref:Chromatin modification-related protein n=1 Tax=Jaapia argillacea MUCL 33604 TaxID=933084 RepID=A0A067QA86_9AGAM|nr:hypothetical protein JAAARDRAFT_29087 [Jaapia argillacea MUCL 33604]
MPPRMQPTNPGNVQTAYSLSLLSEYAHTLDSLPVDLSRYFGDLRELDAVLSSSMASVTSKIERLTKMIEENTGPKEERLWLLAEIAEEASRLKPGCDDKIRVASQAADNLKSHSGHLTTLLEHIPSFDSSTLNRKTNFPHVAPRSFMPATMFESGRRRRAAANNNASTMGATNGDSPVVKRKRGARDDDPEAGNKSPRKEKAPDGANNRRGNGGGRKKTDRAASPTESLLSVTSHIPGSQQGGSNSRQSANHNNTRNGNGQSSNNKRARSTANPSTPNDTAYMYEPPNPRSKEIYNAPPSSSSTHPSLPQPYASGSGSRAIDAPALLPDPGEWTTGQLEGPGMPVARGGATSGLASHHPSLAVASTSTTLLTTGGNVVPEPVSSSTVGADGVVDDGADGDGDDRTYCVCDRPSFGEMIACDDNTCEREWFHLACIGLDVPPKGTWFCEACRTKAKVKRGGRGGKRKGAGGGAGKAGAKAGAA